MIKEATASFAVSHQRKGSQISPVRRGTFLSTVVQMPGTYEDGKNSDHDCVLHKRAACPEPAGIRSQPAQNSHIGGSDSGGFVEKPGTGSSTLQHQSGGSTPDSGALASESSSNRLR